jgi:hypothetical protein
MNTRMMIRFMGSWGTDFQGNGHGRITAWGPDYNE